MSKKLDPMDLKQIISLHLDGYSNRQISDTLSISRNTINCYMQQFGSSQLGLKQLLELGVGELEELFPGKTTINNPRFEELMAFFDNGKLARSHPGFTFLYHYQQYKASHENPYGYTQFMEHYHRKYSKVKGSMKLNHKAGNELFRASLLIIKRPSIFNSENFGDKS